MYSYYVEKTINEKRNLINNKKKKTRLTSLQVQGYLRIIFRKNYSNIFSDDKSTSLSAPLRVSGSMTIEAAIVCPLMLLGICTFLYIILILNFQNLLYQSMSDTARNISRYGYLIKEIGEVINKDTISDTAQNDITDKLEDLSVTRSFVQGGLTGIYAFNQIMDGDVKKLAKSLGIYEGLTGINMVESDFSEVENSDLVIAYSAGIPMVSGSLYKMSFVHRCYFRNFTGKSIDVKGKESERKVFITQKGRVYHLYKDCTHIDLSLLSVPFSSIPSLRNNGGGKYKKCEKCVNGEVTPQESVIITTDGDRYHTNQNCSGIIRNVAEVDIEQVGNRTLCKRCEERESK